MLVRLRAQGMFSRLCFPGVPTSDLLGEIVSVVHQEGDSQALRQSIIDRATGAAAQYLNDGRGDGHLAELLTMVCGGRSFVDACSPGSGFLTDRTFLFECHPMQVFAMLSFFVCQTHLPGTTPGGATTAAEIPQEFLFRSVGTGEGKSIVIAGIGIMCTLMGLQVDVACFSKILAARDENNSQAWCDMFSAKLKYGTIDGLITVAPEYQAQAAARARQVLEGKKLQPLHTSGGTNAAPKPRVLIVDEVDVLFSENMVSKVWDFASMHKDENFAKLYLDIWDRRCNSLKEALASPHAAAVQATFPHLKLDRVIAPTFPAADEVRAGRYVYKVGEDQHGRPCIMRRSAIDGRLETYAEPVDYFAALKESRIPTEAALQQISILTPFASKHALSLTRNYGAVWGLSGTLASTFFDSLRDVFFPDPRSQPQTMVLPTSFHTSHKLTVDDPIVCGPDSEDKAQAFDPTHPENSGFFLNIKKEIEAKVQDSRAVLVVFDTLAQLSEFRAWLQARPIAGTQTARSIKVLPPERATDNFSVIDKTIRVAASRCRVTLATRAFGRGSDFVCTDALLKSQGGMHVIQAFWTPSEAEEVQIKGRTCRQDNPGSYRQILLADKNRDNAAALTDLPYLLDVFGDPSAVKSEEAVRTARKAYYARRRDAIVKDVAEAAQRETKCATFLRNLHEATDIDSIIGYINSPHVQAAATAVIIVCDVSGSMGGRNIDEACSGCAQLLDALQQRNCLADTVTVFTFNHECSVLIETAPVSSVDTHYIQQQLHARVSGGTVCHMSSHFLQASCLSALRCFGEPKGLSLIICFFLACTSAPWFRFTHLFLLGHSSTAGAVRRNWGNC